MQGLGSGPDVPHAVNASSRKTEGNGVGVTKEPPVSIRDEETSRRLMYGAAGCSGDEGAACSICFSVRVIGHEVTWETILVGTTLFVEIPPDVLPTGSKERFYTVIVSLRFV